ncbi:MAG: hypothetical protein KAJ14_05335 [Candidatus Omnitrophica bacterium]|nr:hypothetical protein [Candidatus Omnitrophota bacterium]
MRVEEKQIILNSDDDYEFVNLINHIVKTEYGEISIRVKNAKPYQIVETTKSILLSADKKSE